MKQLTGMLAVLALTLSLVGVAHARKDDIDINRLTSSLDQLSNDPVLGLYAQADQARARDAISRLAQAGDVTPDGSFDRRGWWGDMPIDPAAQDTAPPDLIGAATPVGFPPCVRLVTADLRQEGEALRITA